MSLIECVPNFSEGRRQHVIDAILTAIGSVAGVHILHSSSDADHNRTVMTFVGAPDAVSEAAFQGIQTAANLIDLQTHKGVHPRIGAADVVPFIPLRGVSLETCAMLARRLGEQVGNSLRIPVYLYEQAALSDDRINLAHVRRGGYEVLKAEIQNVAARKPDFGPPQLGPAGAVAIGARAPLIAFNIYLDTEDVEVARAIARIVREAGGGLPCVKALGLLVNGQAQVSMNLTDFQKTGLHTVYLKVQREAALMGRSITHTELIGLMPQAAIIAAGLSSLQLPAATHEQILEYMVGRQTGDYREIPFE